MTLSLKIDVEIWKICKERKKWWESGNLAFVIANLKGKNWLIKKSLQQFEKLEIELSKKKKKNPRI